MSSSEEVYEKGTYGINLLYTLFFIIVIIVVAVFNRLGKVKLDSKADKIIIGCVGAFLIAPFILNLLCLIDYFYYNNDEDTRVGIKKSAMSFSVITIIGLITISGLFFGNKLGSKGEDCGKQITAGCLIVFSVLLFILNSFGLATVT